ncbi:MAG: hypothetical protein KJ645_10225 [Planctomycetes bacterium]|nr:hypothetical protein [Planctomycetota bacterium]
MLILIFPEADLFETAGDDGRDPIIKARDSFDQGRMEEAFRLYQEVIKNDPTNTTALQMAGFIAYKSMHYEQARRYFMGQLEIEGDSLHPLLNLGNIALIEFRPADARVYYLKAMRMAPEDPVLKCNLLLAEDRLRSARMMSLHYHRSNLVFWLGVGLGFAVLLVVVFLEFRDVKKTRGGHA